jgi:hypothetical protein
MGERVWLLHIPVVFNGNILLCVQTLGAILLAISLEAILLTTLAIKSRSEARQQMLEVVQRNMAESPGEEYKTWG